MKKYSFLALFFVTGCSLWSQTAALRGIINHYAAATSADTCTGRLTVSDTTGFRKSGQILLWQVQGADLVTLNTPLSGAITGLNGAGRWERNQIDSVAGSAIFLKKRLLHAYNWAGNVQVITLPVYENARVTDTLKARPWNGRTGGMLALEVTGTLTLEAPLSADGTGFRGGAAYIAPNNNCTVLPETGYLYAAGTWRSSYKGEGVAGIASGREMGRGPAGNGGGGGNDHNSGGGGGAHFVRGGTGGNNDEPLILGCNGFFPGIGGYGIVTNAPQRLFMGGGGGAGHANNPPLVSGGGHGGGVIWVKAGKIEGGGPMVSAKGGSARTVNNDGGGGGGAGGTIWLNTGSLPTQTRLDVSGGNGGYMDAANSNRCHGPGGGGGGGRILANHTAVYDVSGGAAGRILRSVNACNGSTGSAGAGQNGSVEPLPVAAVESTAWLRPEFRSLLVADTLCPGDTARLVLSIIGDNWIFQWQEARNNIWQKLSDNAAVSGSETAALQVQTTVTDDTLRYFRCAVRSICGVTRSTPAVAVRFFPKPRVSFAAPDTLPGCNEVRFDFVASAAHTSAVNWTFSAGQPLSSVSNITQWHTTASGVVRARAIASGICPLLRDTFERTLAVRLLPLPEAAFQSVIAGREVRFSASVQHAQSLQWIFGDNSPGSGIQNPVYQYTQAGTYIVSLIASNGCGARMVQQKLRIP